MAVPFFGFSPPTQANLGIDWLAAQAQPDGHYSTANDIATPFTATAETLRTFELLGETAASQNVSAALDFLNAQDFPSTEHLSRRLIANMAANPNQSVTELSNLLLARLNGNGGLGDLVGYHSTVIDTAWALEAIARTALADTGSHELLKAIDFLKQQQHDNGGWASNGRETSVATTAIVMHALWHYRDKVSSIPTLNVVPALDKAQQYLLAQRQSNGLWEETFESGLALIAILPRLSSLDEVSASLEALRAAQNQNGSWNNDIYSTALALRALKIAESPEPNPDLGQIAAVVIDGQTGLALSGVTVQLTGTTTANQLTNSAGEFQFSGLPAGNYSIQLSTEGGTGLTAETQVKRGQQVNLGDIRLFQEGATILQGTVTDATTGEPLAGATIEATGLSEATVTDNQGAYLISNLDPGQVLIQARHEGYLTASNSVTVTAGTSLVVSLALSPDRAILDGIITDGNTEAPLAGANIIINGTVAAQTDAEGRYHLPNLSSSEHHIVVEHDGYDSVSGLITLPTQTTLIFSPQLYPTGTTPTVSDNAAVTGIVVDKQTGLPLEAVTVTNGTETATTDTTGRFNLTQLAAAPTTLEWQLSGYLNKTLPLSLSASTQLDLGEIVLTPEGYLIPVGVKGLVMDASTNQTLADVNIEATLGETAQSLTSQTDGTFDVSGQVENNLTAQLSFTTEGYVSYTLDVLLVENEILDLGQVRLRPEEVTVLLPDLLVEVDNTAVQTEPQTLAVSGSITAQINNAGTAPTSGHTTLLAFYDVDLNGIYDKEADVTLGEAVLENALAVEESATVDIALAGELPFRDAPINVWVDNAQTVVESDEQNNVGTTAKMCEVVPDIGTFEPVLKWEWTGSSVLPQYNQVMSIPIVAPLEDTNDDGKINQFDIPSVIFHTYRNLYTDKGVLRAVSGKDGSELWTVSNHWTLPESSIAVADIDHDGLIEIIVPKYKGGLIAFEHTGEFKWQSSMPAYYVRWGGTSIADINGDEAPEIIVGNTVLNADGSLLWQGSGFTGNGRVGPLSVVADIDLDGKPEIIAGAATYSNTGLKLWQNNTVGDGFVAIGNFNNDKYPEIVVVSRGRVFLLNHTGSIIWGPVSIPGGGYGGAPTIAELDDDGIPEIGVAGASRYAIFKADGSLLWTTVTRDYSSNVTGSSVFDFDGDGQSEVVYADERYLRVYHGSSGNVVFETPNSSGTTYELPVIVDVDNDNHADIVVCANQLLQYQGWAPWPGNTGIRVFQDKNNRWVKTRKIWNQHSYHITNINDDGTVPAVEQNSWEVHNTYRLNTTPGQSVTAVPDLTAGRLHVIDNGVGQPVTLQVRIGNAGAFASSESLLVTFYAGDPALGGTELGTVTLENLAPGTYQDVQLEGVELLDFNQGIYAVVDASNMLEECNETNNQVSTSISAGTTTLLGRVSVTTDAPEYGPNAPVAIDYTITNQGALPALFQVELRIENADGETVEILDTPTLGTLAGGETLTLDANWNTGTYLAAPGYQVHVRLIDRNGELVTQASHPFSVTADEEVRLNLQTTVEKPIYHTTDTVQINNLIQNQTVNTLVTDAVVQVTVFDSANQPVFRQEAALDDLAPKAQRETQVLYRFQQAAEGLYTVQSDIVAHNGEVLASHTTPYQVQENLKLSLLGQVQVQVPRLYQGEPNVCTDTLTNDGTLPLTAQAIRQRVMALDSDNEEQVTELTLDIEAGSSQALERTVATGELDVGAHACVLQALIEGQWETLGYAVFQLDKPPIQIDLSLTPGEQGRLLILLDDGHPKDNEPHGSKAAPTQTAQQTYLEALLEANGWSYTIVTDEQAFTRELRSGGYLVYALLSEHEKLAEQVQKELREAVYRGEGLVVAGAHDQRNHVDEALGIKHKGKLSKAQGLVMPDDTEPSETVTIPLAFAEPVQRAELNGALTIGTFQLDANNDCQSDNDDSRSRRQKNEKDDDDEKERGNPKDRDDEKDNDDREDDDDDDRDEDDEPDDDEDERDEDDDDEDRDEDDDDDRHEQCAQHRELAMSFHEYGEGQSVYVGFDLLAQATATGQDSLFADVLLTALSSVHPERLNHTIGRIIPLRLELTNQGLATAGQALIYLPEGTHVITPDEIEMDELDWAIVWPFELNLDQVAELEFWLRLPWVPTLLPLNAQVQTGTAPDFDDYESLSLEIDVIKPPCLPEALEQLTALKDEDKYYALALKSVQKAATYIQQEQDDKALKELLKAADKLLNSNHPEAHTLRVMIGNAIRNVAWLIDIM